MRAGLFELNGFSNLYSNSPEALYYLLLHFDSLLVNFLYNLLEVFLHKQRFHKHYVLI